MPNRRLFNLQKRLELPKKKLDTPLFQNIINEKKPIKFEDKQNQYFEYYYPFKNEPECQMCHGKNKDILGVLHLKISTADLNMQIKKAGFILSAILILAGVLIAFFLIIFLNRVIVDPLVKIGSIVAQVGQGNFDVKVEVSRGDEIGIISDQINSMIRDLKEQDKIKRSLYLAQEVQQNLLPHKAPRLDKLEIAGKSIYCDETGGDYYDFIISDNDENERIDRHRIAGRIGHRRRHARSVLQGGDAAPGEGPPPVQSGRRCGLAYRERPRRTRR